MNSTSDLLTPEMVVKLWTIKSGATRIEIRKIASTRNQAGQLKNSLHQPAAQSTEMFVIQLRFVRIFLFNR